MDGQTLGAYDRDAPHFAEDWAAQPPPTDLYAILGSFFAPGGPTADIGCGAGRDTAWLDAQGYPAIGFDASDGLLAEARRRHPQGRFDKAALPLLDGVAAESFANILCETVIMHLDTREIAAAVARLLALLRPGGTLYLSWRVTEGAGARDGHGRLYSAFDAALVLQALSAATLLLDEQVTSLSSGKVIRRLVARKPDAIGPK